MKLPRDLFGDEVCRALKRLGSSSCGRPVRIAIAQKDGLHPCVPMHSTLKPKTLQSILKQGKITLEQLLEEL